MTKTQWWIYFYQDHYPYPGSRWTKVAAPFKTIYFYQDHYPYPGSRWTKVAGPFKTHWGARRFALKQIGVPPKEIDLDVVICTNTVLH